MKIAYLFSRYPVPSQTFCDTEMRALEDGGAEIEIYSCSPPVTSFRHGPADRPRARVFYAPPGPALMRREAESRRDGSWPAALVAEHEARFGPRYDPAKRARHALYFADLARRRGVKHVHVHFANRATHAALFLRELAGVPFSFTAHAQDFLVDLGSDELLGEMCVRAAFVVAVSDFSRRALIAKCPASEAKIHRIYNGLPLARWPAPEPPTEGASATGLRIFSVGRLIEFKGFADLVAACALLRAQGVRFHCEIAGEGPLREALERRIAEGSLGNSVKLVGLLTQDEVRARLAACDVFALACRVDDKGACDVLPTVILEAMATSRPVVSTRLAGVPEMVDDGVTGRLVAPTDPPALAGALAELTHDPALRASLGRAGREKLVAGFDAAGSARQLSALFTSSRTGRSAAPAASKPAVICLCDRAPDEEMCMALAARVPGARWVVFAAGENDGPVRSLDYLPDAMVLESCWREDPATAHRLESWRGLAGGSHTTDAFLLAARRALYLWREWSAEAGGCLRHLHARGPQAVLCAFLLRQLGAAEGASLWLPPSAPGADWTHAGARRLAAEYGFGWVVGERKLVASLGAGFRSEIPDVAAWADVLAEVVGK